MTSSTLARAFAAAAMSLAVSATGPPARAQETGVLTIRVSVGSVGQPMPVARHALLISDDPVTAPPRRAVTNATGTAEVRLRPGRYTVESDQPAVLDGRAYLWIQSVSVGVAGATIELSEANAEIATAPAGTVDRDGAAADPASDPVAAIERWNPRVVSVWTNRRRGSGLLLDEAGLVATSRAVVGDATTVEVQVTAALKVEGRVLPGEPQGDVAMVAIAPVALTSVPAAPARLCAGAGVSLEDGDELAALGVGWNGTVETSFGGARLSGGRVSSADFRLASASAGGPVFSSTGAFVGVTASSVDTPPAGDIAIVSAPAVCAAASAAGARSPGVAPAEAPLPVEPAGSFPVAALDAARERRGASLAPYRMTSSDFEIAFITPPMTDAADRSDGRTNGRTLNGADIDAARVPAWHAFGEWADYVATRPAVVVIRITPKLSEGFWTTVARGAARVQGVALPAFKRFRPPLARLRIMCGEAEVRPVHTLELASSPIERETVVEVLVVVSPEAIGPACGKVTLALSHVEEPDQVDTRTVERAVIERIWADFEPYRAASAR